MFSLPKKKNRAQSSLARAKNRRDVHGGVAAGVRLGHGEEALELVRVGHVVRPAADLEEDLARGGGVVARDVELVLALHARVREHLGLCAHALVERVAEAGPVVRCRCTCARGREKPSGGRKHGQRWYEARQMTG